MAESSINNASLKKLDPVPVFTDSDSFVVIKSAEELENMSYDSEIADMSLLLEHKMLLHEELAQLEGPSLGNRSMLLVHNGEQQEGATSVQSPLMLVDNGLENTSFTTLENTKILAENEDISGNGAEEKLPSMPPEIVPKEQNEAAAVSIISFAPSDFGSEEIQAKVNQLIEENTNLKVTVLQNNKAMQLQCDRIVAWKEDNERIHDSNKRKFQMAKLHIVLLKNRIETLEVENGKLHSTINEMKEQLSIKQFGDQYCANLQDELDLKQKQIVQLENELRQIRDARNMEAKIESLKTKKLPSNDSGELLLLRQQLMQSQMALTESEQKNADSYMVIEKLQTEISQLSEQFEQTKQNDDDMFALKTQLEIYRADFEAERAAREELKRDKDKIAEDLQHLHRRNQQLQEEIELVHGQNGRRAQEFVMPEAQFKCPKCNFGFSKQNALMNHIDRCIDIDDTLP